MHNINDIKQLPGLYNKKDELDSLVLQLKNKADSLKSEEEIAVNKAREKYKRFETIINAFKEESYSWWYNYYLTNSPTIIDKKIYKEGLEISKAQVLLELDKTIDNNEFKNDIYDLINDINTYNYSHKSLTNSAVMAAEKAMLYNICIYTDGSDWTIKKFDESIDWGLHLCPKGINKSIYKYWFFLNNPYSYFDLKKAADYVTERYNNYLLFHGIVHKIIQKYNIKSADKPIEELQSRLRDAQNDIKEQKTIIEKCNINIRELEAIKALVQNGKEAFMSLNFDKYEKLRSYKNEYRLKMKERLRRLPDYQKENQLCDDIVQNIFDYKEVSNYADNKRPSFKKAIEDAPKEYIKKREMVEREMKDKQKEYELTRSRIKQLQDNYTDILTQMTMKDPASTFFYQAGGWINKEDKEEKNLAVCQIDKIVRDRKRLEYIPAFEYLNLGGTEKAFISKTEWQSGIEKAVNLFVKPLKEDRYKPDASLWAASNLLTTILLSLPIRKVHFTIIDFNASTNLQSKLFNRFNKYKNIYTVIRDMNGLSEVKKTFFERTEYKEDITEVIVWTNYYSDDFARIKDELIGILDNGADHGYYTIAVSNGNNSISEHSLKQADQLYKEKEFRDIYAPGEDFNSNRSGFLNAIEAYINEKANTSKAASIIQESMEDGSAFRRKPTEIGEYGLSVPIGIDENNHQEAFFEFNGRGDLPHTFILGGSGSGKSYLLHNILLNSMLKYRAEDLEFYLMDLKMGGAEFRFYENMPHVSHLLIDDADHQAVFEILDELCKKMRERGRKMGTHKDIVDYNEHHPNNRMPYIVLVVDECHKLFESESESTDFKMQESINRVIKYIVKEGRSQGVTFIFATQTLVGMDIPTEVKNEARNKYLMRVTMNEDADRLFNGGSVRNGSLSQGYAYHEAKKTFIHIYDYHKFSEQAKNTILSNNKRPAGRNNYVFSGKDEFPLPTIGNLQEPCPVAYIGKSVNVSRNDIIIPLSNVFGSNILITGVNDETQSERVFFSAALSLAAQTYDNGKRARISIFDNLGRSGAHYYERERIFKMLEKCNNVRIFQSREERLRELARLGNIARTEKSESEENILLILAQEKMRRLLSEDILVENQAEIAEFDNIDVSQSPDEIKRAKLGLPVSSNVRVPQYTKRDMFENGYRKSTTAQDELIYILKNGGDRNVHVIMQVNQPGNILQEPDLVMRNDIRQWFVNIVMLKCSQESQIKLPLDNSIRLERLSDNPNMLRAVYLNNDDGETKMFTPYVLPLNN